MLWSTTDVALSIRCSIWGQAEASVGYGSFDLRDVGSDNVAKSVMHINNSAFSIKYILRHHSVSWSGRSLSGLSLHLQGCLTHVREKHQVTYSRSEYLFMVWSVLCACYQGFFLLFFKGTHHWKKQIWRRLCLSYTLSLRQFIGPIQTSSFIQQVLFPNNKVSTNLIIVTQVARLGGLLRGQGPSKHRGTSCHFGITSYFAPHFLRRLSWGATELPLKLGEPFSSPSILWKRKSVRDAGNPFLTLPRLHNVRSIGCI